MSPGRLLENNEPPVDVGYFEAMKSEGVDPFEKRIGCFDVTRLANAHEFGQKCGRIMGVFKDVRGDHEIKSLVLEWQALHEPEDQRSVFHQRRVIPLDGVLVGVQQDVRTRIRVAARPDVEDQRIAGVPARVAAGATRPDAPCLPRGKSASAPIPAQATTRLPEPYGSLRYCNVCCMRDTTSWLSAMTRRCPAAATRCRTLSFVNKKRYFSEEFLLGAEKIRLLAFFEHRGDVVRVLRQHQCSASWNFKGKVVTWGPTREEATGRMIDALDGFEVGGVATLIPFHRRLLETEQWCAAETCRDLLGDRAWLKLAAPV